MKLVSKFMIEPEYDVTVVTVRDIFQSMYAGDKFGADYQNHSAVIIFDESDMRKMSMADGGRVKVKSSGCEVVLTARKSEDAHPGIAFMPNSIYANALIEGADDTGIPEYKQIGVTVSRTTNELTGVRQLVELQKNVELHV